MAAQEIKDFLENGNIKNSVNFPACDMGKVTGTRLCVIHKNIPAMLSQITDVFTADNTNIENMMNKSRGDYAYTMIDVDGAMADNVKADVDAIDGVIKSTIYTA
jgi:D-3-phosphoglycerate dehydrogenase